MENSSKFSRLFMEKSPLYNKADRLRERAKRRSKRLGEPQDYDYEDAKVQKLLSKAEKAEKSKPSLENDPRVGMSYERPDMPPVNYGTPLNQVTPEYGSSSGYISIQPALQALQTKTSVDTDGANKSNKNKKNKQVVDVANGKQINASKPTKDLAEKVGKYNQFQDLTKVRSVDGNFVRVDGKGNMYSMEFDKLGKKILDMDQLSKAAKVMTRR